MSATTDHKTRPASDQDNRLAFLGALAGGLAHEIKNPLSTMSLNLQLLEEELQEVPGPQTAKSLRRVKVLSGEVQRLKEILNDFLRYAANHKLNLAEVSLNDVIEEALNFLAPEADRRGIDIRPCLEENVGKVPLDAARFKQALLNLLINAQDAIGDKGGEIFVHTHRAGGEVTLEVIDTGCGIAPDIMPRIFDVYFSAKKTGTGLGLPTARRIVEEHGGTIDVESEVGKGTRFQIHLPASRP